MIWIVSTTDTQGTYRGLLSVKTGRYIAHSLAEAMGVYRKETAYLIANYENTDGQGYVCTLTRVSHTGSTVIERSEPFLV